MDNPSSISISISLVFVLLLLLLLLSIDIVSGFSPNDNYLLNCGSTVPQSVDNNHRTFITDTTRLTTSTHTFQLQTAGPSPLYNTARAFHSPIRYSFPLEDRGTHHLTRLHFHNNSHEAQFHVIANGFLLLHNFRVPNFTVIKEFIIPVDDSEELDIVFIPSRRPGFGFVNAIEVITVPKDVVADVARVVGPEKEGMVEGLLRKGFETVYRVNVGGYKVTPFNDSLWRTWVTDDEEYLRLSGDSLERIERVHFGGRIRYQEGGASREVGPDNVYNSGRVIRSVGDEVPRMNITWRFKVDEGYSYMVRVHFCDIVSVTINMLYFNVYVNGRLAYENLDLTELTSGLLASPFYADFVASEMSSGVIEVSVGPSNMSLGRAADAILNGVEIWKINNSMDSFDGEVCAEFLRRSWRRENGGVLIPFVAFAVFLMLTGSIFMQRRRNSSVGWSRLPVDVSEANFKFGDHLSSTKV